MRLTSTVAEYQKLARTEDHASRLEAWTTDYEAAHRDVFDVYYRSYSDPRRRINAVADVARISPLVREWEARAEALTRQTVLTCGPTTSTSRGYANAVRPKEPWLR